MKPIRVLQVFTTLNIGGAESMIMNYYRQIDKTKIQFDFVVHRPEKGAFEDEIIALGGNIFRLPAISPFFPGSYLKEMETFLKSHTEFQIIHSHLNAFSGYPLMVAKKLGIPFRIAHAHIAIQKIGLKELFFGKEKFTENLKKLVKLKIKHKVLKHATHYFSCGDKAGKWLFGNHKFTILNNCINTKKFTYNKSIELQFKKQYRLENKLVIGHIGRFGSQKNHDFLLKIFNEILKLNKHSQLVLLGDGPLRTEIEQKSRDLGVTENVTFLGVKKNVAELCQMFDVFVFPSFYEGLPVTLVEAQAAGLKVFASDTITREVGLSNDVTFLPLKLSEKRWAKQIIAASTYQKMNTYEVIKNAGFDIVENTLELEKFYTQLIANEHESI